MDMLSKDNLSYVSTISNHDIEILEHQVGGHAVEGSGVLKHKNGYILKPKQDRCRGDRELAFYQEIYGENETIDEVRSILQLVTPTFLGIASVETEDEAGDRKVQEFIKLEDVVSKYSKPCIIDIKIGTQTWNSTSTKEKIKKESSKYVGTRVPLGISVAGMYYYDVDLKEYIRKEKDFGRSLTPETLYEGLKKYLNFESDKSKYVVKQILEKLKLIEKLFLIQDKYSFYASSLLIVYDATLLEEEEKAVNERKINTELFKDLVDVFMIDFAHVFPLEDVRDENYLFGLRSVIQLFSSLSSGKHYFERISSNVS